MSLAVVVLALIVFAVAAVVVTVVVGAVAVALRPRVAGLGAARLELIVVPALVQHTPIGTGATVLHVALPAAIRGKVGVAEAASVVRTLVVERDVQAHVSAV